MIPHMPLSPQIAAGSDEAIAVYYQRFAKEKVLLDRRLIGDDKAGEDAARDSLLKILDKIVARAISFASDHELKKYLMQTNLSESMNWHRKRKRVLSLSDDGQREAVPNPLDRIPDWVLSMRLAGSEHSSAAVLALGDCLDRLPFDFYCIVILRVDYAMPANTVALLLGYGADDKAAQKVYRLERLAKRMLANCLGERGFNCLCDTFPD